MTRKMLIDAAHLEEVRVCVLEHGKVEDFDFEYSSRKPLRGNIYLARVTRVEPSLQAAFVEYGGNRHGFLAFNEIHPDYYQIPISDRRLLQEADEEEAALAAELDIGGGDDADLDPEDEDGVSARFDELSADDDDSPGVTEAPSHDNGDDHSADADHNGHEDDAASNGGSDEARHAAPLAAAPVEHIAEPVGLDDETSEDDAEASQEDDGDGEEASDEAEASGDQDAAESEPRASKPAKTGLKRSELMERYKDARRKRARLLRNYKIQEVIKRRQIMLVQVVKEERGSKGAALTTYMSLAGRYCVLMPNTARGGGISRKIPVAADRKRLKRVVDTLDVPQGMGLIIRTAGAKRTKAEIKRDYDYLIRLWENIRTLTLKSIAPSLIYEEASLIKRAIRDLYDKDIDQVLVEGDGGYREAKDFMKMLMPSHAKNVQPYKEKTPLFLRYDVESQLDAMYQPTVRLKSGGYIVIHQTEALVAIDVNSGKATRERNIELTALKTNLEAAKEAARQCRLRDLAGLIVIDFIDMEENKNNRAVEKRLKDSLKDDRARIQVGRISNFGLMEMSRQRRRSGIVDGTTHSCPTCSGAGVVRTHEMAALRILRAVESGALTDRAAVISVKASLEVTLYILNHKRDWLRRIEEDYAVTVEIVADNSKAGDQYDLDKRGAPRELPAAPAVIRADQPEAAEEDDAALVDETDEQDEDAEEGEAQPRGQAREGAPREGEESAGGRRRRRRRRRGRRDEAGDGPREGQGDRAERPREDRQPQHAAESQEFSDNEDEEDGEPREHAEGERAGAEPNGEQGDGQRRRRRRGRRGGRRNRRPDQDGATPAQGADPGEGSAEQPSFDETGEPDDQPFAQNAYDDEGDARVASEPLAAADVDDTPEPDAYAPAEEPVVIETVAPEPERKPEPVAAAPVEAGEPKPAKRGWWNRAIGG